MTVKKLSKKKIDNKEEPENELANNFISGGGKTTEESSQSKNDIDETTRFTIRIPKKVVKMIDNHRKEKIGNISRNTWILESIAERLKRGR